MTESHPIPLIARTAFLLLREKFDRLVNGLGDQTIAVVGLKPDDNWTVDFDKGEIRRDVPDAPAPPPPSDP